MPGTPTSGTAAITSGALIKPDARACSISARMATGLTKTLKSAGNQKTPIVMVISLWELHRCVLNIHNEYSKHRWSGKWAVRNHEVVKTEKAERMKGIIKFAIL